VLIMRDKTPIFTALRGGACSKPEHGVAAIAREAFALAAGAGLMEFD